VPSQLEEKLILGLQDGIYSGDFSGKTITKLSTIKELGSNQRLNDGKCDPNGRLWVGGLNMDKVSKASHLFMIEKNGRSKVKINSVSISNGIVWSKSGHKMFYIDTPTRTVKSFDFEIETGEISNPKVLIHTPDTLGWPDGMAIDENDNLFIGMWGGSCVSIWSSFDGKYLGKILVAAKNVTSCSFGGKERKTLFITSARQGLSKEDLEKYPLSGQLFQAQVEIAGPQMAYWKSK
jgi:sugar lactone lactonase YvrE